MKINGKIIGIAAIVAFAATLILYWVGRAPEATDTTQPKTVKASAVRQAVAQAQSEQPAGEAPEKARKNLRPGERLAQRGAAAPTRSTPRAVAAAAEEISEERIAALEKWEDFIDKVSEREGAPTDAQAKQFKREFQRLVKEDREDAMQTALNLLPDEQFALLYPILFDKSFDVDILDMIFSDGLNHDDEIKIPMMKAIYQDKTHPMYEEAERILEVTGELDEDDEDDAERE